MSKLIKCKTCGNEIAKSAKVCPHCGAKNNRGCGCSVVVLILVIIVAVGLELINFSSSDKTSPKPQIKTEKKAEKSRAANPIISNALAYLRKVDDVCRVDIVENDVFLSFTNNELPLDYKLVANAAAVNASRALVEAGEVPSRCTVWIIPAENKADVGNSYYTITARKGKVQK